jgi:hypothetical protein
MSLVNGLVQKVEEAFAPEPEAPVVAPVIEEPVVCAAPVAQDTSGIRVESGVPMPTKHHRAVYPIDQMDVGNSIAMPLSDRSKLRAAADAHRKKNAGWGYISRTEDGVFRIWRTS